MGKKGETERGNNRKPMGNMRTSHVCKECSGYDTHMSWCSQHPDHIANREKGK